MEAGPGTLAARESAGSLGMEHRRPGRSAQQPNRCPTGRMPSSPCTFPASRRGQQRSHFFYEADRGTENTTRFRMKLRAHYHFVVKQNRQRSRGAVTTSTPSGPCSPKARAANGPRIYARRPKNPSSRLGPPPVLVHHQRAAHQADAGRQDHSCPSTWPAGSDFQAHLGLPRWTTSF